MKKFLSLAMAAILVMGNVGCRKKSPEDNPKSTITSKPICSYKAADISMGDNFMKITDIDSDVLSGSIMIFGQLSDTVWGGYITDESFADYTEFRYIPQSGETVADSTLAAAGKKALLVTTEDSADILVFDRDGKEIDRLDCGNIITGGEYGQIISSGSGYVLRCNDNSLYYVDSGGISEVDTKGMAVYGVSSGCGGSAVALLDNGTKNAVISEIEGDSLGQQQDCGSISSSALVMCPDKSKNTYSALFMDGIYTLDDKNWVRLTDFSELEFSPMDVMNMVVTASGEIAVLRNKSGEMKLELLTERDISELNSKKVLRLATRRSSTDPDISEIVKKFNAENEDYRIEIISYDRNDQVYLDNERDMKLDILGGNVPDIIVGTLSGVDPEDYYMDLYPLLDNDPDISREDFIPGFLEGIEHNGKLLEITSVFSFTTMIAKSKFPFVKANWSYEEFFEAYRSMPEGMVLDTSLKNVFLRESLYRLISINDYVDFDKAACHFDAPEFTEMLRFVKDEHLGMTQAEAEEWDGSPSDETSPMDIRNDKRLVRNNHFFNIINLWQEVKGTYGEDVTFTGRPSLNGKGSYVHSAQGEIAVFGSCAYPEGAWEFMKYYFSDWYYNESNSRYCFPVIEKYFDEKARECLTNETYINEEGYEWAKGIWQTSYDDPYQYIILDPLTEEELERYCGEIKKAAGNYRRTDNELQEIIMEELDAYFNSDVTAETAADLIQNRASIYLSETYG